MCGICGDVSFDGKQADAAALQKMMQSMAQRGPDSQGVYQLGGTGLGHVRLKIIDLSQHSAQPMVDAQLGLAMVFNGCIYNYQELRSALEKMGYSFFSQGDTEVLLKAYHAWGKDFVTRLNGMFAFAISERDTGRLILGRDRLGIKPLYYKSSPQGVRFASTLPALLAAGEVDTSIDPVGLHYYMHWHGVVPAPQTIIKGVRKLPPATLRVYREDGEYQDHTFWQLSAPEAKMAKSEEEWRELVFSALQQAVKRRMVADVPVGVLLSGGLDSSMLVGILAEAGQKGLNTFSIGFDAAGGEAGDEFQYSDLVAQHFQTHHHKISIPAERLLENLPATFAAMSEPMVSYDNIGFYLLAQEVSAHVKVVQSGQGADEVFAGYHWYPPLLKSKDGAGDYCRLFFDRDQAEYREAIHGDYLGDNYSLAFVQEFFATHGDKTPLKTALQLDTTVMLVDDPVKRVDNMTMAWSLEARVPFLDHELVELAAQIPEELKVRGQGKWILKEAARKVIPGAVIDRPKGYFPVPALKHIQGPYLDYVQDHLQNAQARQRRLFKGEYVDQLLADPTGQLTPLRGSKLWQLAALEIWLQTHGV